MDVGVTSYLSYAITVLLLLVISIFLVNREIKNVGISTVLIIIKYSLSITYFGYWCDKFPIMLRDDIVYYQNSLSIYHKLNGNLFNLFSKDMFLYMGMLAGGSHFGFYIFNCIGFFLMGESAYAPIFLNLGCSTLTALILYKTFLQTNVNKIVAILYLCFLLIQWDLIAWSSFINLKDTFVLLNLSAGMYCMIKLQSKFHFKYLLVLLLVIFVFLFVRFYLSYFLLLISFLYFFLLRLKRIESKYMGLIMKGFIFLVLPVLFYIAFRVLFSAKLAVIGGMSNPIIGFPRYLITPFPFNISSEYKFIFIPSILHWLILPFMVYGFYVICSRYLYAVMPLLLLFVFLGVFYGSFPELQGPRHRIPLLGLISLCQFLGLYEFIKQVCYKLKLA